MSVQETDQSHPCTTFIWTIENFVLAEEKSHKSPEFRVVSDPFASFYLNLRDEYFMESSEYFSLFLVPRSRPVYRFYSFTIGLITRDGKQTCIKFAITFENVFEIGVKKFIEKEKVMFSLRELILPDGNLTLFCEVKICKVPLNPEERIELKEFSDAFVKLYESGKYSDATIEVQEKSFKVHKPIIEARFPDLMKTLNGSVCKIESVTAKTFETLLQYLYSGYLKISDWIVNEVLNSGYKIPTHLNSLLLTKLYLQHHKINAVTRIGKRDISFTWKVDNFKSLKPGEHLCYDLRKENVNLLEFDEIIKVFLTVSENKENLILSIDRYRVVYYKYVCNIKISGVNKSFFHSCKDAVQGWTLPGIPLKEIFTEDINFSGECDLNLDFKISVLDPSVDEEKTTTELFEDIPQNNAEDLGSLQNDLENLYKNRHTRFSDVLLKTKTNKIPAHRCILSARSTTFADMLQNGTTEEGGVDIDLEDNVAEDLLFYIYSNRIHVTYDENNRLKEKSVIDMYNAANKYKLPGLRKKCCEVFEKSLNADMAGEVFIAAYDCDDTELKEFICNFVCSNLQDILQSKKWNDSIKKRADITAEMLHKTFSHFALKQK